MSTYQLAVFMVYAFMFFVVLGAFVFMIFFGNTEVPLLKRSRRVSILAEARAFCGELPRRIRPAFERATRIPRS